MCLVHMHVYLEQPKLEGASAFSCRIIFVSFHVWQAQKDAGAADAHMGAGEGADGARERPTGSDANGGCRSARLAHLWQISIVE